MCVCVQTPTLGECLLKSEYSYVTRTEVEINDGLDYTPLPVGTTRHKPEL